jgi:hypothetical protein
MNSPGDFTTSPFLPTTGEIQTIGIAISPRKEGALPVTTRGMNKGNPSTPSHTPWPTAVQKCLPPLVKTTAANGQSGFPYPVSLKLPLTERLSQRLAAVPAPVTAVVEPTSMTWLALSLAVERASGQMEMIGARHSSRLQPAPPTAIRGAGRTANLRHHCGRGRQ